MKNAAQPFNNDVIAGDYDRHRSGGGPHLRALAGLASKAKARRVLEVGCGTGNSAAAFLKAYPCDLVGVDRSAGMLTHTRGKGGAAHFVNADGVALPLRDGAFEFVFGVLMLHLNANLDSLFSECGRVLSVGRVAFVTAPHDFIERHVLNEYFPSFAAVDRARFQHEDHVQEALRATGFVDVGCEITRRDPEPVDAAYVERVAGKFITTLRLIPDDEFDEGIERLRRDVSRNGQLDKPMIWEAAVISGRTES